MESIAYSIKKYSIFIASHILSIKMPYGIIKKRAVKRAVNKL